MYSIDCKDDKCVVTVTDAKRSCLEVIQSTGMDFNNNNNNNNIFIYLFIYCNWVVTRWQWLFYM